MASLTKIMNCNKIFMTCGNRLNAALSTSSARPSETKGGLPMLLDNSTALMNEEEKKLQKRLKEGYITVDTPMDITLISGVPEEHIKDRYVRIFPATKNSMQSGTNNVGQWSMAFETRERWENPLMGWTSTGDPLSNMQIGFNSPKEAIEFCEKNGWKWFVDREQKIDARAKAYAVNFSWNKKSRVSTK